VAIRIPININMAFDQLANNIVDAGRLTTPEISSSGRKCGIFYQTKVRT